ncbi:GNAT family N-acetyltransferase [uncultured Mameliella sp.]|uniref:GNAT family N-acetyltransferase n=1 Tax=uncultured Mameliella sp. TaxID=1447087 RepID=UPI0026052BCA|nr:GNAT family N-acetyltransferase [uncultured Mameliella sp.]
MSLILRTPRPEDVAPLTEGANMPGWRAGTLRLPFTTPELIEQQLFSTSSHSIVADLHGGAVGMICLMPRRGRQAHMSDMYLGVRDDAAGNGVGRALLAAALDLADNWLGLRRIYIEVAAGNDSALRLYESAGFEHEGVLRGDTLTDGRLQDSVAMGRMRPAPAMLSGGD